MNKETFSVKLKMQGRSIYAPDPKLGLGAIQPMTKVVIKTFTIDSIYYEQELQLRDKILRKPLGMSIFDDDLSQDKKDFHIGAIKDGKLVGVVLLSPQDDMMKIRQAGVDEGYQRRGIGSKMVVFCEEYAIENGYITIILHARKDAVGFYERLGYRVIGDEFTEVSLPHLKMTKSLRKREKKMKDFKIVCFDADDTLWLNEIYYQEIEEEFILLMSKYSDMNNITKAIHKSEIDNLDIYGYGAKGFMLSMLETALDVSGGKATSEDLKKIIEMGRELINKPIVLLEGVVDILEKLANKGYRMIVATKGDLLDQERKLRKSGLDRFFIHKEIMSDKKSDNFKKLTDQLGIDPNEFLMIGNSMKSDILPVLEIGGSGIHVPHHTTWAHELAENVGERDNLWVVDRLGEVAGILDI